MGVGFDRLASDSQAVLDKILAQKHHTSGEQPRFDMPIQPDKERTKVVPASVASTLQAAAKAPVAVSAAAEGKKSGLALAPSKGGFPEESSRDATPLPKPI